MHAYCKFPLSMHFHYVGVRDWCHWCITILLLTNYKCVYVCFFFLREKPSVSCLCMLTNISHVLSLVGSFPSLFSWSLSWTLYLFAELNPKIWPFNMKTTEQYFSAVLCIMLYQMVLCFDSDESLESDHSNKSYWAVPFCFYYGTTYVVQGAYCQLPLNYYGIPSWKQRLWETKTH